MLRLTEGTTQCRYTNILLVMIIIASTTAVRVHRLLNLDRPVQTIFGAGSHMQVFIRDTVGKGV